MVAVTLVFSTLFFIMALIVGGLVGWVYREHVWTSNPVNMHPEMFDESGHVIPDEIIAFRFDNEFEEEEEPED